MAMAVFLVALVACGADSTATSPVSLQTPDIQATLTALALSEAQALTPTPVPEGARRELIGFVAGYRSMSDSWDRFHQEIDQWREDVAACVPASVESALEAFAGRALGITHTARSLDRLPYLETQAASLAAAADQEAAAFESLSKNWTPEIERSVELFLQFASARSAADLERGKVFRSLLDRQNSLDDTSLEAIESFAAAVKTLNTEWDQFHRDYDAFRVEPVEADDDPATSRLGGLLIQFGSIVDQVQALPNLVLTQEIAERLAGAADGEQLLLRRLLNSAGEDETKIETVKALPDDLVLSENGDGSTDGNGEANRAELVLNDPTLFDVFDSQISSINRLRRTLRTDLSDVRAPLSEAGSENLSVFLGQARALEREWDAFHDSYDQWRSSNGRCDQGKALEALGQLATGFGGTVQAIEALSSVPLVREMRELLLWAAEREQAAVFSLRDS
jgi:hypothetical protein